MFTSCGVAGFPPQYQVQAPPPGPPPGLGVSRQVQTGLGVTPQVTPGVCPAFQGQAYVGPLFSASSAAAFNGASVVTPPTTRLPMPPLPPPPPPPPPTAAFTLGGQGGFKKVCRTEDDGPCPFPGLAAGVLEMRVKEGSKIRNLMGFAMARMQGGGGGGGAAGGGGGASGGGGGVGLRQVVFTGSGRAVTKTITCAEIMKRKVGGLHQMTKLRYKGVREVWESQEGGGGAGGGGGGASEMTVHKTVPSISILLSKDPLDPQEPGYQPPQTLSALWEEREGAGEVSPPTAAKRPLGLGLGLGLAPHTGYPHSKRVCLGEGSILTPR